MSTQLAAWHVLILDARGPRLVFENSSSALTDLALLLVRPEFEQAPDHTCSCGPQSLQSGDRTRTHRNPHRACTMQCLVLLDTTKP